MPARFFLLLFVCFVAIKLRDRINMCLRMFANKILFYRKKWKKWRKKNNQPTNQRTFYWKCQWENMWINHVCLCVAAITKINKHRHFCCRFRLSFESNGIFVAIFTAVCTELYFRTSCAHIVSWMMWSLMLLETRDVVSRTRITNCLLNVFSSSIFLLSFSKPHLLLH